MTTKALTQNRPMEGILFAGPAYLGPAGAEPTCVWVTEVSTHILKLGSTHGATSLAHTPPF